MSANVYVIEDYENETSFRPKKQTQFKPNSNPISSKARADTIKRTKARYDWNKVIADAHIIFLGQIISALTFLRDLICGCFFYPDQVAISAYFIPRIG